MGNSKHYIKKLSKCFVLSFLVTFLFSCTHKNYLTKTITEFKSENGIPDYNKLEYWASHPWKKDAADNIPLSLGKFNNDSLADVFFIYPTTYTDETMQMGWNAAVDNIALNIRTQNTAILYQASVFNEHCRIFSPIYRQANLQAFNTADKEAADKAFDIAYQDIKAAFEFYLNHYNSGKPIIIASHSQGTLHAGRLLKEFFEGKSLQKKLVCAYIIGLPVFKSYFKELKPCTDSASIGCFISWRTFKEGYIAPFVKGEKENSYVTNPLTWKMEETFAPSNLNKGGILRNFNKVIPGLVHAQVHENILWVNKPKFFGNIFLTMKNYHIADYNLFYVNIRQNVTTRIRYFLQKGDSF